MKKCIKCGNELIVNKNWYVSSAIIGCCICIHCCKIYRIKNKEKIKAFNKINCDWFRTFKEFQGCTLCGYDKCGDALTYHHVNPKEKTRRIAARGMHHGHKETYDELLKCVLLCSNCHKETHYLMKH